MTRDANARVIAIPSAQTDLGQRIVQFFLGGDDRLALGAPPAQFQGLDARIDGRDGVYCQPVDLDRPSSVTTFFHIERAQVGPIEVVVLEALPLQGRRLAPERAVAIATRRLLHCLDAALAYAGNDLHFISINPPYGLAAIPVARAFLDAKLAASGVSRVPQIRMSVVCPSASGPRDDESFARSIAHVVAQPQCPDITEAVLLPRRRIRIARGFPAARSSRKLDENVH